MPKIGRHSKDQPIRGRGKSPLHGTGINFYTGKPRLLANPKDRPRNGEVKIIVPRNKTND